MLVPTKKVLRRTLELSIAAARGGPARLQILLMLEKHPMNINQVAKEMSTDYKTAQHHIRVLEKSGLIISSKNKYDNTYALSTLLRENTGILKNLGKSR